MAKETKIPGEISEYIEKKHSSTFREETKATAEAITNALKSPEAQQAAKDYALIGRLSDDLKGRKHLNADESKQLAALEKERLRLEKTLGDRFHEVAGGYMTERARDEARLHLQNFAKEGKLTEYVLETVDREAAEKRKYRAPYNEIRINEGSLKSFNAAEGIRFSYARGRKQEAEQLLTALGFTTNKHGPLAAPPKEVTAEMLDVLRHRPEIKGFIYKFKAPSKPNLADRLDDFLSRKSVPGVHLLRSIRSLSSTMDFLKEKGVPGAAVEDGKLIIGRYRQGEHYPDAGYFPPRLDARDKEAIVAGFQRYLFSNSNGIIPSPADGAIPYASVDDAGRLTIDLKQCRPRDLRAINHALRYGQHGEPPWNAPVEHWLKRGRTELYRRETAQDADHTLLAALHRQGLTQAYIDDADPENSRIILGRVKAAGGEPMAKELAEKAGYTEIQTYTVQHDKENRLFITRENAYRLIGKNGAQTDEQAERIASVLRNPVQSLKERLSNDLQPIPGYDSSKLKTGRFESWVIPLLEDFQREGIRAGSGGSNTVYLNPAEKLTHQEASMLGGILLRSLGGVNRKAFSASADGRIMIQENPGYLYRLDKVAAILNNPRPYLAAEQARFNNTHLQQFVDARDNKPAPPPRIPDSPDFTPPKGWVYYQEKKSGQRFWMPPAEPASTGDGRAGQFRFFINRLAKFGHHDVYSGRFAQSLESHVEGNTVVFHLPETWNAKATEKLNKFINERFETQTGPLFTITGKELRFNAEARLKNKEEPNLAFATEAATEFVAVSVANPHFLETENITLTHKLTSIRNDMVFSGYRLSNMREDWGKLAPEHKARFDKLEMDKANAMLIFENSAGLSPEKQAEIIANFRTAAGKGREFHPPEIIAGRIALRLPFHTADSTMPWHRKHAADWGKLAEAIDEAKNSSHKREPEKPKPPLEKTPAKKEERLEHTTQLGPVRLRMPMGDSGREQPQPSWWDNIVSTLKAAWDWIVKTVSSLFGGEKTASTGGGSDHAALPRAESSTRTASLPAAERGSGRMGMTDVAAMPHGGFVSNAPILNGNGRRLG